MRAHVGDRIVLAAEHVDQPTRDGEVLEVHGQDGGPPYVVRWDDGRTGTIYPGPGSVLHLGGSGTETDRPHPSNPGTVATVHSPGAGTTQHLREWKVRISLLEAGDDTRATVVLVADPLERLSAQGSSHRGAGDAASSRIGDEVAVARALRHLADQLLRGAEHDIGEASGEAAHVRPM